MKITNQWLSQKQACGEGVAWFLAQPETDGVEIIKKLMALGVMATVMAIPRISRVRRGMPAVLHSGAAAMKARMRASG